MNSCNGKCIKCAHNRTKCNLALWIKEAANKVAHRFPSVDPADIKGPVQLGVFMADGLWEEGRGMSRKHFAIVKGINLAIDEMYRNRVLFRHKKPKFEQIDLHIEDLPLKPKPFRLHRNERIYASDVRQAAASVLSEKNLALFNMMYVEGKNRQEVSEITGDNPRRLTWLRKIMLRKLRHRLGVKEPRAGVAQRQRQQF